MALHSRVEGRCGVRVDSKAWDVEAASRGDSSAVEPSPQGLRRRRTSIRLIDVLDGAHPNHERAGGEAHGESTCRSSDSRGRVPHRDRDALAGIRIPNPHRPILAGRGQMRPAIAGDLTHRHDPAGVALHGRSGGSAANLKFHGLRGQPHEIARRRAVLINRHWPPAGLWCGRVSRTDD